jgi:hypothetical protein
MRITIAGGHGQIAQHLERQLTTAGHEAVGLVRNPDHVADLEANGAEAVVLDLEHASVADVARALGGSDAVVFAAGGGPNSGAERKETVDKNAAILLADAAEEAGVARYLMISSMGAEDADPDSDDVFQVYLRAKKAGRRRPSPTRPRLDDRPPGSAHRRARHRPGPGRRPPAGQCHARGRRRGAGGCARPDQDGRQDLRPAQRRGRDRGSAPEGVVSRGPRPPPPPCPGPRAPEHRADLTEPDVAIGEPVGQPLAQPVGKLLRPLRARQVGHRHIDLRGIGGLDRELLEPGQRLARRTHPLERTHLAVVDPQDRLHGQRRADEGRGGAHAAAATQVLQRVHVEQRRRGRRPGPGGVGGSGGVGTPVRRVSGGEHREPGGHADLTGVDGHDRHGLSRAASWADS